MPIYEYRCTECGFEKECLQKISDPVLTECPSCLKPTFKKKVSAPSFRLKGDGWYETDFKTSDKKNLASNDSGDSSSAGDNTVDNKGGENKSSDSKGKGATTSAEKSSAAGTNDG